MTVLGRVATGRARWYPVRGVHPSLEVRPPVLGEIDVSRGIFAERYW